MSVNAPQRFLLCDDHPICCHGLRTWIESLPSPHERSFHFAHDGEHALVLAQQNRFDYVFMDVKLPGLSGLATIRKMLPLLGSAKVIMITGYTEGATVESLREALDELPIHAVITKSFSPEGLEPLFAHVQTDPLTPYLSAEIQALLSRTGSVRLTKRETEIIQLIASGFTTREIAQRLNCSQETVKTHRGNILSKTRVRNVAELGAWFSERYGKPNLSS